MAPEIVVALLTGIIGFLASIITLVAFLIKFRGGEQRLLSTGSDKNTADVADKLVSSANTITQLQKDFYNKQLEECKTKIDELDNKILELGKQITYLQEVIDDLSNRDVKSNDLVKRLLLGINLLIKQLKTCGLTPVWQPEKADLKLLIKD
jgi:peptidoglycan hydrolase CwlO-like protein